LPDRCLSPSSISDSTVTSDDLLAWLRPFCGDASLPVRPRIDVLQILESNFILRDSDVRLLLLYRTQAVLKDREPEDKEGEEHKEIALGKKSQMSREMAGEEADRTRVGTIPLLDPWVLH
ncbi:hypothetical protein ATANTOWER_015021, partial [Ataeniobius toweri]|nr:hypothetical protein [Ataeniobius toweri]